MRKHIKTNKLNDKTRCVNMKLNLDKIANNGKIIVLLFLVFSVFVGLSCISATDGDNITLDDNNIAADDNSSSNVDLELDDNAYPNDSSNSGIILDENGNFDMTVRGQSASTGYRWEISPETYGVDVIQNEFVPDHRENPDFPEMTVIGGGGTSYFTFHVNDDYDGHFYVKLLLVTPSGKIAKEIDSNMLN